MSFPLVVLFPLDVPLNAPSLLRILTPGSRSCAPLACACFPLSLVVFWCSFAEPDLVRLSLTNTHPPYFSLLRTVLEDIPLRLWLSPCSSSLFPRAAPSFLPHLVLLCCWSSALSCLLLPRSFSYTLCVKYPQRTLLHPLPPIPSLKAQLVVDIHA